MTSAVERHEAELARSVGTQHAVAFGHARHAIVAALEASGLNAGDGVVLSPLTCKVVPLALLSLGLAPRYADIDRATLNLSAQGAADLDARALLFQHTYGSALGADEAEALAGERGWALVEDCAQCMPTRYGAPTVARPALPGSSRAAVFSNNLMKPLPAASGGVAVTNDGELAARIRRARDAFAAPSAAFGASLAVQRALHRFVLRPSLYWPLYALARRFGSHYEMHSAADEVRREVREAPGRISAAQARIGSRWLARADDLATHRRRTTERYARDLAHLPSIELPRIDASRPLCYFPVLVSDKPGLLRRAQELRVELTPWPISTPIYPVEREEELRTYGYEPGSCPVAEQVAMRLVGLPTHAKIGERERVAVVELVAEHAEGR